MNQSVESNVKVRASTLASSFSLQIFEGQELPGTLWYHCEVSFYSFRLGSSDVLEGPNASWHCLIKKDMSVLKCKENENNRSYKYEYLDVMVYEHAARNTPGVLCASGRIQLSEIHIREPRWVYLASTSSDENEILRGYAGKILVNISLENLASHEDIASPEFLTIREILENSRYANYGHLYMDYDCSSSAHMGSFIVPGPKSGEIVHDFYDTFIVIDIFVHLNVCYKCLYIFIDFKLCS